MDNKDKKAFSGYTTIEGCSVKLDEKGASMTVFQLFKRSEWSRILNEPDGFIMIGVCDDDKFAGAVFQGKSTNAIYGFSTDDEYGKLVDGRFIPMGWLDYSEGKFW